LKERKEKGDGRRFVLRKSAWLLASRVSSLCLERGHEIEEDDALYRSYARTRKGATIGTRREACMKKLLVA